MAGLTWLVLLPLFHVSVFRPISRVRFPSSERFRCSHLASTAPRMHDNSKLEFQLGCRNDACCNSPYRISNFSTFSSLMSLDVTF